jgi:hypothetical protein
MSTITNIEIYLNERDDLRDTDVKLSEFRTLFTKFKKHHEGASAKKSTRASTKASSASRSSSQVPAAGSSTPAPATSSFEVPLSLANVEAYLSALPIRLTDFYLEVNQVLNIMYKEPTNYIFRTNMKLYTYRIIATSGLMWSLSSKNRGRDLIFAAICAVFESIIVPRYRPTLLVKCPGVAAMRDQLADYLLSIAEANHQDANDDGKTPKTAQKPGDQTTLDQNLKAISTKEWFFADDLHVEDQPRPTRIANPKELQRKLVSSHVSSTHRKNNEIGRFITSVMNSKYAACHKKGVEPGTIETAIHDLLTHLNKVRLLSCGRVSCRRVSCGRMHITRQAPCSALTHLPPPHDR